MNKILEKIFTSLDVDYENILYKFKNIEEIRIRIRKPIIIKSGGKEYFIDKSGEVCNDISKCYFADKNSLNKIIDSLSGYSLFAFEEELKNGFITTRGGHRIGVAGKVITENGAIKTIKEISSINIRIAHEIKGCAKDIVKYIFDTKKVLNTLIISPPSCGKTTLLRDIIRIVSSTEGQSVAVLDERNEIAASVGGIPQNDIGIRSDVLDLCPKSIGMLMALRSLSPTLIAVDEIGTAQDFSSIEYIINSGVSVISTIHAENTEEILNKKCFLDFKEKKYFKRYIVLTNRNHIGEISGIYDENFNNIYEVN